MGLLAAYPLFVWLKRGRKPIKYALLAAVLLIGPLQALPLFNLGYKFVLSPDYLASLRKVETEAGPSDVVAFLPDDVQTQSILSPAPSTSNFYVSAFTGLRAFYTSRAYTARESGLGPDGDKLYESRISLVRRLQAGIADNGDIDTLRNQGVRWIVLPAKISLAAYRDARVWISGADFTVVKISGPDPDQR
jgi:hypothetical protein